MLQWSARALKAVEVFFRPLQDIDVFVEDVGSEIFYTEMLARLTDGKFRIYRVLPLGGRLNVEDAARKFVPGSRPSLFMVDGDLDWVADRLAPIVPFLLRIPAYCIENLLITEAVAVELLVESHGTISRSTARALFGWSDWQHEVEQELVVRHFCIEG